MRGPAEAVLVSTDFDLVPPVGREIVEWQGCQEKQRSHMYGAALHDNIPSIAAGLRGGAAEGSGTTAIAKNLLRSALC